MSNLTVVVWMVTYNHGDFIEQAIESVMKQQTNFKYELFIGEDCSKDQTRNICKDLKNKYPDKITLFLHENNMGSVQNGIFMYERCIESEAKYIALCEGDDYWIDSLKLQKQVDLLEKNRGLIACHHWQKIAIKENGRFIERESPKDGYYPNPISKVEDIFSNKMRIKSRTLMFKNIVNENFFPKWFHKIAYGDVSLSFLLGVYGDFGFINEPMSVYRYTEKGLSTQGLKELGPTKFNIQHFKNWIKIWDYADKHHNYKYHKIAVKTVKSFLNEIASSLPITLSSSFILLQYNIFERKLPLNKTFSHTIWIVLHYLKFFGYKFKKRF